MKTILVYYSFSGNNEALAFEIQRRLDCPLLKIAEIRHRTAMTIMLDLLLKRKPKLRFLNTRLEDYDKVILMAPVWAGRIATPMGSFIRQQKGNLPSYSFITVCGGHLGQEEKIRKELAGLTGKEPEVVTQLMVKDLLAKDKQGKTGNVTAYRIREKDLQAFDPGIEAFLKNIGARTLQPSSGTI